MSDVVLFDYWRSTASYRVRIALNLLAIDFHSIEVDLLKGDQSGPAHLIRNPQRYVPVLDIDGLRLTQSLATISYLDETRGAGFLPNTAPERARVRAIADAIAMDIHPVCNPNVVAQAIKNNADKNAARSAWMQHFIRKGLVAVEGLLDDKATGKYCHGDHVSLADICLIPQLYNAKRWNVDISDLTLISSIEIMCAKIPHFQAAYPSQGTQGRPI